MSTRYPLFNRELGILGFNERVLAQAADTAVPLLERLRFICITSSNLDEFFEVRMAGLQEQMRDNPGSLSPDGMSLQHVYDLVVERAHRLVRQQYAMLHETVLPALESEGIYFHWRRSMERRADRVGTRILLQRAAARAHADRPRPRASVSARAQQEPELRGRTGGQGRFRTSGGDGHRAGAARAAAPRAHARSALGVSARLRAAQLADAAFRQRAFSASESAKLQPVSHHAQ